jgi:hypothetical protein
MSKDQWYEFNNEVLLIILANQQRFGRYELLQFHRGLSPIPIVISLGYAGKDNRLLIGIARRILIPKCEELQAERVSLVYLLGTVSKGLTQGSVFEEGYKIYSSLLLHV